MLYREDIICEFCGKKIGYAVYGEDDRPSIACLYCERHLDKYKKT